MDYLSIIKHPVEAELADFISLFNSRSRTRTGCSVLRSSTSASVQASVCALCSYCSWRKTSDR